MFFIKNVSYSAFKILAEPIEKENPDIAAEAVF